MFRKTIEIVSVSAMQVIRRISGGEGLIGLGIMFVALNLCDAHLTKIALSTGGTELNPLVVTWGSSLIAKASVATGIALMLYAFGKEKLLWPINKVLLGVVLWNLAVCAVTKIGVL